MPSSPVPILPLMESLGGWARGPARIVGSRVVLDFKARSRYYPMSEPELPCALARLRTDEDVIAFVERFGLLRHGDILAESEFVDGVPDAEIPAQVSESLASFFAAAREYGELVSVIALLQEALREGERSAIAVEKLAEWAREAWPAHMHRAKSGGRAADLALTRDVEMWVAAQVSPALAELELGLRAGYLSGLDLGTFRFSVHEGKSLLNFAAFHLALQLTSRTPILECEQCGELFPVRDKRQRFCGDTCASRDRVQRLRKRRKGRTK